MNIWQFQSILTRRLLVWSLFSIVTGGLLQIPRDHFSRGISQQFAAWGFVDALIAVFGRRAAEKRYAQLPDPLTAEVIASETRKLRKILWANACLDVGYVTRGWALTFTKGKAHTGWRGHGVGIIIQGVFLLFFDLWHAIKL